MFKIGNTYHEVGELTGLTGELLEGYISYMVARWARSEEEKSKCGYAGEWAWRFLVGKEFEFSDIHGKRLLFKTGKYTHKADEMLAEEEACKELFEMGILQSEDIYE